MVRPAPPAGPVDTALERFGITELSDRLSSRLSSGQRTLVGIVKATLHEPSLLVLDEACGEVVANDTAAIVASTYGHDNLEDVFLSLAETHGR